MAASHPRKLIYGGEPWWRGKDGYYLNNGREKLHRRIYEDNFGPIPPRYVVHHIDHDRGNNSPDNLTLMSLSEHVSYHQQGHVAHPAQLVAAGKELRRRWKEAPVCRIICKVCVPNLRHAPCRHHGCSALILARTVGEQMGSKVKSGAVTAAAPPIMRPDARSDIAAKSAVSVQPQNAPETGSLPQNSLHATSAGRDFSVLALMRVSVGDHVRSHSMRVACTEEKYRMHGERDSGSRHSQTIWCRPHTAGADPRQACCHSQDTGQAARQRHTTSKEHATEGRVACLSGATMQLTLALAA
jgi:hypothetical protein